MMELEQWLDVATRGLAPDSAMQVRREITEHYESAWEAAPAGGVSAGEAERSALSSLGDAKAANCEYRRVLLTKAEAKLLREGKWEAQAICSRPWLKWLLVAIPVALVETAAVLYFRERVDVARDVLLAAVAFSPLFAALLLPINTPSRGRIYRCAKWVATAGAVCLFFGPDTLKWSWLLLGCVWPMVQSDLTRASIRRKLPSSEWPRHLYL